MRISIDIDDELHRCAMDGAGDATIDQIVEEALRLLIRMRAQVRAVEDLRGLGWYGDLDEMRRGSIRETS